MARTRIEVAEVPGRGFQKRTAFLGPDGQPECFRIGGLPYARPLSGPQRWRRAEPLPAAEQRYFGPRSAPADFSGVAAECPQPGRRVKGAREACHELNVWVPAGTAPAGGWPVLFYIHGGFLQWGSPNLEQPAALFAGTPLRAVVVAPAYRLNVFGFLACAETLADSPLPAANLGFWDQRLALEWAAANVAAYGGDPANITLAGLSAGAYSVFHQLAHEALRLPRRAALIRRAVLWSNGCGLPPKPLHELRAHFAALLAALGIPADLPAADKLARLRAEPADRLVAAVEALPENAFRAAADDSPGTFIAPDLFTALRSGALGRELAARGVRLLLGEVRDEVNSYRLNSPPSSYSGLVDRLAVEYPAAAARRIADAYCEPSRTLPAGYASWQDLFGRAYADMQVHVSQRALIRAVAPHLPPGDVLRYRICYRPKCVDAIAKPAMGVMHGSDMSVWWFGNGWGRGLTEQEKPAVRGLVDPLAFFIWGEDVSRQWGTNAIDKVRTLAEDGSHVEIRTDERWDEAADIWSQVIGEARSKL